VTLTGQPVPAEFDAVRRGLVTGRLGVDSAVIITSMLSDAKVGVPTDELRLHRQGEHELVCAAIGAAPAPDAPALPPVPPAETAEQAGVWKAVLNADGPCPADRMGARGFTLRPVREGLVPVSGMLLPEVAGQMQAVFDSLTNAHQSLKFLTNEQQRAHLDAEQGPRDPRSRSQRQHDALTTIFDVAARSGELPTLGGAAPTMLVTVLTDHDDAGHHTVQHNGHGSDTATGQVAGIDIPISPAAVAQLSCANGVQHISFGPAGKILRLGSTERCFTRAQRRALAARDGGCIICRLPPQYTEAHHVLPWAVQQQTHVDNGVLLCWYHHRTIHTSGWRIRMTNGHPEVMPPPGLGPQHWQPAPGSRTRAIAALETRTHTRT
jgi:hypothetical protein